MDSHLDVVVQRQASTIAMTMHARTSHEDAQRTDRAAEAANPIPSGAGPMPSEKHPGHCDLPASGEKRADSFDLLLRVAVVLVAFIGIFAAFYSPDEPAGGAAELPGLPSAAIDGASHPDFLYARVTTVGGGTYEGRVRFGGEEEALWGHYFNGLKKKNPWVDHVPHEHRRRTQRSIRILGLRLPPGGGAAHLARPFMVRFGDISRIDAIGDGVLAALEHKLSYAPEIRVTLKNGATVDLDRFSADDFADGLRIWDDAHGVIDLTEHRIRSIEFLPAPEQGDVAQRLYGTVHTRQGTFAGFVQWERELSLGSDILKGVTDDGVAELPFADIRAISRRSPGEMHVTMHDGRTIAMSDVRRYGQHRGMYVDDGRYGRVLVSWDAFERVEFSNGARGPAYDDFPPTESLTGSITTRDGRRLTGKLVYDLDESSVIETLDAPSGGVDYTILFGFISSIEPASGKDYARVTLHSGEELRLEQTGDLGDDNAGLLVFLKDEESAAEYVPWSEVVRVDLNRPRAMYPPLRSLLE